MTELNPYQPNPGETLLFENERVRVWSMTIEPGDAGLWHSHQHDHVLIWPWEGRSKGQQWGEAAPTATQIAHESFVVFKAVGEAGLHPHRLHNIDAGTTTHFIVELLEPSPFAEEGPYIDNGRGESYLDADREAETANE